MKGVMMETKKVISFLLFIFIIISSYSTYANANYNHITINYNTEYQMPAKDTYKCFAPSTITPSDFDPTSSQSNSDDAKTTALGNKIIVLVQAIGSIVSVISLILIGIKYMLGSAEEKAEYKSTMIPYLIGSILVFCASNIIAAIYKVMT